MHCYIFYKLNELIHEKLSPNSFVITEERIYLPHPPPAMGGGPAPPERGRPPNLLLGPPGGLLKMANKQMTVENN